MKIKAYLQYERGWDNFSLYLKGEEFNGQNYNFGSLQIISAERHDFLKPFIDASVVGINAKDFMQAIMDEAWKNGMRPTGFEDIENETKAIRNHLNDMRTLVFKGQIKPLDKV